MGLLAHPTEDPDTTMPSVENSLEERRAGERQSFDDVPQSHE